MLSSKCPGQDMRYWSYDDISTETCPQCGESIEFWKTDVRLRCRKCGKVVINKKFDLGCAEWCAYAKYCIGDIARGNTALPVKKRLQETAFRLLQKEERDKLSEKIREYEKGPLKEEGEIVEKIALAVFEAIGEKHGERKVTELLDEMLEKGEMAPEIVQKIRESRTKEEIIQG
ncbi:MAG: hypothetical protein GX887_04740 [Firmicutes bacterium]|nr:hypothetical protein [Bacillota bacterium]